MTPDILIELIGRCQTGWLVNAAASMSERDRQKLSKTASQARREIERNRWGFGAHVKESELWQRLKALQPAVPTEQGLTRWEHSAFVADLAVLAFCPLSQAKRVDCVNLKEPWRDDVIQVLLDRHPDWLDAWIDAKYDVRFGHVDWEVLYQLMKAGACQKPRRDEYVAQMARDYLWQVKQDASTTLSERLLAEPEFLEDTWRFFEIETGVPLSANTHLRTNFPHAESWSEALAKLSAQGHLDRQRLLDASLGGMHLGFDGNTLAGYIAFFEFLEPSVDELARRDQRIFDLLSVQAPKVTAFVLKMAKRLEKDKRLDAHAFLTASSAVFGLKPKAQPKAFLTYIGQLGKRQPEAIPWAVGPVCDALTHDAVDIQEKAVGLLETWAPRLHPDHATTLRDRLDDVAPTTRGRLEAVLRELTGEATEAIESDAAPRLAELASRVDRLDRRWADLAGVPSALDFLRNGTPICPLAFERTEIPILPNTERIAPIQTVEELIDTAAHAVEELESADELERILDGISRLGADRPDDFARRTEALVKRIGRQREEQISLRSLLGIWELAHPFRVLFMAWLRRQVPGRVHWVAEATNVSLFVQERLREIIDRLMVRQSAELLAAPTHRHGWIAPEALVQRLIRWQESGQKMPKHDFIQAMLRLTPDGRDAPLAEAAKVHGDPGRVLRWALGGNAGPTDADQHQKWLWFAAGRARNPLGELPELAVLGFQDGPDVMHPARYDWECTSSERDPRMYYGRPGAKVPRTLISTDREVVVQLKSSLAAVIHLHSPKVSEFATSGGIHMEQVVWPANLQPAFVRATRALMQRIDMPSSTLSPHHTHFESLFDPDQPWPEMAYLMVCIGLLTIDTDSRTAATDALIEGIADGRAHPTPMADVICKILEGGWVKLNRLTESLQEVARVSPLHAWTAASVLYRVAATFEPKPRNAHHVLELLLQLLTDLGLELEEPARNPLTLVKGSSKTAKAAKALLALKGVKNSARMQQAAVQALEARVERAERWSGAAV
jgi:uncharacterized protein DUF6493